MERNPYLPPAAAVADVVTRDALPPQVLKGIVLLWVAIGLGLVAFALVFTLGGARSLPWPAGTQLLGVALVGWVIAGVRARRHWARLALLALLLVSVPVQLPAVIEGAQGEPVLAGLWLLKTGTYLGALYLFFFPGREWFR